MLLIESGENRMSDKRLLEISDRVRELKLNGNSDCAALLRTELQTSSSQEEKVYICDMLAAELHGQNRVDEAESVLQERIALDSERPEGWINLALHFHYYAKEPEKALSTINMALDKAKREGSFYRQAHLERIRIALQLKSYSIIEDSLRELINYFPTPDSKDIRLETEFLARIPKGAVNKTVIADYEAKVAHEVNK
jgi:tetratricopeptide (TPR) repeat protein